MSLDNNKVVRFFREKVGYSLLIVVCSAILVELISLAQYRSHRKVLFEELGKRTAIELFSNTEVITHTLESAEGTLQEHLWDIRRCLSDADSIMAATGRLVESNDRIVGACIAFIPGYYPEKGRLFEPYATKEGGVVQISQIASESHDYSQNPDFIKPLEDGTPFWSDPYKYEEGTIQDLTTYSYPITDNSGRVVAVCGLDIDLSWLSDTLNAKQYHPSSFGLMVNDDGFFVAGPSETHPKAGDVGQVVGILNGTSPARVVHIGKRSTILEFKDSLDGEKAYVNFLSLDKDPYWQVAQVSFAKEVYSPLQKIRKKSFLFIMAGLIALFYMINRYARSERKLQTVQIDQARIGSELRIAKGLQMAMLPKEFPSFIKASITPAREVGGDIFDFFTRDGKLFFCIGDVSGKGVPAAILMSVLHFLFRMVTSREDDPSVIVKSLNKELCRDNTSNMFVTFFLGVLDQSTGILRYCNAGHDKPVLVRKNISVLPAKANLPLGVFPDVEFESQEMLIPDGGLLFLYTDGLTEAKNTEGKLFGMKRVIETLELSGRDPGTTSCAGLLEIIEGKVKDFVSSAEQSDDLTMMAIRFNKPTGYDEIPLGNISFTNNLENIGLLSDFIKGISSKLNLSQKNLSNVRLAVEEIVVNVINYAYPAGTTGDVSVEAFTQDGMLEFVIIDKGVAFDPTRKPEVDLSGSAEDRPIGGLGILLAHNLMDSLEYERVGDKNVLTMVKNVQVS